MNKDDKYYSYSLAEMANGDHVIFGYEKSEPGKGIELLRGTLDELKPKYQKLTASIYANQVRKFVATC